MNFGISTACFYPEVLTEDTIEIISDIGFSTCEVFFESFDEMKGDILNKIKYNLEKYNLNVRTIHPFPSPFEPFLFDKYERRRLEMESKFIDACMAANFLGAEYYVFHGERSTKAESDAKWTAYIMDNLSRVAAKYNVKIAWENVSWCRSNSPDFIKAVLENMNEKIYFTLDVKQANRSFRNIDEYLNVFKDRLVNVHISDTDINNDCLLPGFGEYNLVDMINKAKALNRDCQFIIEVYRDNFNGIEDIKKSFNYIKNMGV